MTSDLTADPSPQRYPLRKAHARRTLAAIVEAASELFAAQGYTATTILDVSKRAGVGRATVFTAVPGGKPELLKMARDRALAGDDDDVPVSERSWSVAALAQTDPAELLRIKASNYRDMLQRVAGIEAALEAGAESAPELVELRRTATEQRRFGARAVANRLAELTPLRAGLSVQSAADTITVLISSGTYRLLTEDYGWTPDKYEEWLTGQLFACLLPAGVAR